MDGSVECAEERSETAVLSNNCVDVKAVLSLTAVSTAQYLKMRDRVVLLEEDVNQHVAISKHLTAELNQTRKVYKVVRIDTRPEYNHPNKDTTGAAKIARAYRALRGRAAGMITLLHSTGPPVPLRQGCTQHPRDSCRAAGINPFPSRRWLAVQVYNLSPHAVGSRRRSSRRRAAW
eukprot:3966613-Pyramimonas_sp.AAC.1